MKNTDRKNPVSEPHRPAPPLEVRQFDIDANDNIPSELHSAFTMLSNPPPASSLHARQRQHRRQNSTPTAYEAVKIAPLPTFQQQRPHMSHRRGLSLDTRRSQFSPTTPTTTLRQDYTTVSTSTNTGSATPQHVLREAQQQRIARPGPGQPAFGDIASQHHQLQHQNQTGDGFLLTPNGTPHNPHFVDAMAVQGQIGDMSGLPMDAYMNSMNAMMKKNQTNFTGNNIMTAQEFDIFGPDSALSTPTFMTFPEPSPAGSGQGWISESEATGTHSRRASRRISGGIMDKVAKFEALGTVQRPATPPAQNVNSKIDVPLLVRGCRIADEVHRFLPPNTRRDPSRPHNEA